MARLQDPAVHGCGPLMAAQGGQPGPLRLAAFETVRAAGTLSRADLAKRLRISPGSVTPLVADLVAAGLLREAASDRRGGDALRGRPPVALSVADGAGLVAGIKLSDRVQTAVIVTLGGRRVAEASLAMPLRAAPLAAVLDAAEAVLEAALAPIGRSRSALACIGVGLPGLVRHGDGRVLWSPLLDGAEARVGTALAARLGRPVALDNDANLLTLAELWFGAGRALPGFAVVTIEHGLGMGLVIGHRLYRGAGGLGMELGHTKVQLDGALCRCGQRGCLEAYIADYALVREASTALNWGPHAATPTAAALESLYSHAKAGNASARAIFARAGRYLAAGLANVVNLFDPGLILLSGERMRYDFLFAQEVLAETATLTLGPGRPAPRIEARAWGDMVWAQGAAALALEAATPNLLAAAAVRA